MYLKILTITVTIGKKTLLIVSFRFQRFHDIFESFFFSTLADSLFEDHGPQNRFFEDLYSLFECLFFDYYIKAFLTFKKE